jgi:oligoendopeptidase F
MIYKYSGFLMSVVFSVCLTQSVLAKDTDLAEGKIIRPSTPLIWNLNDLYPDIKSWGEARKNVSDRIRKIGDCKGRLSDDIQTLSLCMDTITDTYKDLLRLYTYAFLSKDADLSDSGFRERSSVAQSMLAHFGEAVSFLNPELVAIGDIKINKYLKESLILKNHNFYILNTLRQSKHVLSPDEESIIAALQDTMNTAASAYEVLTNAEIPWPEITLSDGRKSRLDPSGYTSSRGSVVRKDRELVFNEFWSTFHDYRQTLAITLEGQVKNDVIMARVRGYESSLEQALSEDNIPVAVYESLVSTVNKSLPSLHRLIKLRQQMLKLDKTEYFDTYPSVISMDKKYSLVETKLLTIKALRPLGDQYIDTFTKAVNKDWMHVYPSQGKRSGAYVMGAAYDVHPYVLLNFDGTLESVSTFAHEWGHAMHSLMANQAQPFTKADYATFIAEIASTANEILLFDYLRKNAVTDQERLYFLFKELSQIRGTFFRQTQFAEFELAIHRLIEKGEALSGDKLNKLYGDILKRYYGHHEGVMNIDDLYTVEWAYIPHFYRNFYVYQYATSISAAYFLTDKILSKENGAQENFLGILRAGGSDYPYSILKNAGVDMATQDVYEAVIRRMNGLMDEVESILER